MANWARDPSQVIIKIYSRAIVLFKTIPFITSQVVQHSNRQLSIHLKSHPINNTSKCNSRLSQLHSSPLLAFRLLHPSNLVKQSHPVTTCGRFPNSQIASRKAKKSQASALLSHRPRDTSSHLPAPLQPILWTQPHSIHVQKRVSHSPSRMIAAA